MMSWNHSYILVQLLRINQDILVPDQTFPSQHSRLFSPFTFSAPFECVFVCLQVYECVHLCDKLSEMGGLVRMGCVSIWRLMIDGQLQLPWEYVIPGKNPWCLVHLQRVGTGSAPQWRTIHMPSHCCISNNLLKPTETGKWINVSLIEMPLYKPPPIVTTSTLKDRGTCIIGTCVLKYLPVIC